MRITVIGRSPAWQDAGGACSGYLVETDSTKVLIDCGSGVFGKLRGFVDHRDIDAVVISHEHADHILDLFPYSYALLYGPSRPGPKTRLFLPPGVTEVLRTIGGTFDREDLVEDAFEVTQYDPEGSIRVGDLTISMVPVPHFRTAHAMAFTEEGSDLKFVFGADCAVSPRLVEHATGADIVMLEATLPPGESLPGDAEDGHLRPEQAAQMALDAGAGRLILTHASDCMDLELSRAAAAEVFGGEVALAREGLVIEL